jgi:hypothetical protein
MKHSEYDDVDWGRLRHISFQWRVFMDTEFNLRVP